jgi:hypothetical protein
MDSRNAAQLKVLYAEFRANGYRFRSFESWLIHELVQARRPAAEIRAEERGRVLAEIEKWIFRQVERPEESPASGTTGS